MEFSILSFRSECNHNTAIPGVIPTRIQESSSATYDMARGHKNLLVSPPSDDHDGGGGGGVAASAGGSHNTNINEIHDEDDYLGTICDHRSSVSSITNDCAPISYDHGGTGLLLLGGGYSYYHGDEQEHYEQQYYNILTPGGGAQEVVQHTGSHQRNEDFGHPNVITITPSNTAVKTAGLVGGVTGATLTQQQKESKTTMEVRASGMQGRGRLPWYHIMSNQYHFKTHPTTTTTDPTISSSTPPPMTAEIRQPQHAGAVSTAAVFVPSFPLSNLVNGPRFERGSDVDSDSLAECAFGSSTQSDAGFGSFVYRKVRHSSRRNKILLGIVCITAVAAFSAAVVGLLETTDNHADRSMNPTVLPENDFTEEYPSSTRPTFTPTTQVDLVPSVDNKSDKNLNMFGPPSTPSSAGSKNITAWPTPLRSNNPTVGQKALNEDELVDKFNNLTAPAGPIASLSREPTSSPSIQPSTHRPTQQNTSQSPTTASTTHRPTQPPSTVKPSPSLSSRPPTPKPTRAPSLEPTLFPVSLEPTVEPSSRKRPSPSPVAASLPPTEFPVGTPMTESPTAGEDTGSTQPAQENPRMITEEPTDLYTFSASSSATTANPTMIDVTKSPFDSSSPPSLRKNATATTTRRPQEE